MGGIGSGRIASNQIRLTEGTFMLDVRWLQREGWLSDFQSRTLRWEQFGVTVGSIRLRAAGDQLHVDYTAGSAPGRKVRNTFDIAWTTCQFGGRRPWLMCTNAYCARRVALLYFDGKASFACRVCLALKHSSQLESAEKRLLRRAGKVRERLGWNPGIATPRGPKPKGMHRSTYERLDSLQLKLSNQSLQLSLEKIEEKLFASCADALIVPGCISSKA